MSKIKPISNEDLRNLMKGGKVTFVYKKNDSSLRIANGTLNNSLIAQKSKGGRNNVALAGYSVYFDLDKNAFRCYAESRLVGVVES